MSNAQVAVTTRTHYCSTVLLISARTDGSIVKLESFKWLIFTSRFIVFRQMILFLYVYLLMEHNCFTTLPYVQQTIGILQNTFLTLLSQCQIFTIKIQTQLCLPLDSDITNALFLQSLLLEMNTELLPFKKVTYACLIVFDMGDQSLNKFNLP